MCPCPCPCTLTFFLLQSEKSCECECVCVCWAALVSWYVSTSAIINIICLGMKWPMSRSKVLADSRSRSFSFVVRQTQLIAMCIWGVCMQNTPGKNGHCLEREHTGCVILLWSVTSIISSHILFTWTLWRKKNTRQQTMQIVKYNNNNHHIECDGRIVVVVTHWNGRKYVLFFSLSFINVSHTISVIFYFIQLLFSCDVFGVVCWIRISLAQHHTHTRTHAHDTHSKYTYVHSEGISFIRSFDLTIRLKWSEVIWLC